MVDQEELNQRFAEQLGKLDEKTISMEGTMKSLVVEVHAIKRVLWVIAGAILANIDPGLVERLGKALNAISAVAP